VTLIGVKSKIKEEFETFFVISKNIKLRGPPKAVFAKFKK